MGASKEAEAKTFPRSLDSYGDADVESIPTILKNRVKQESFNLFATLIFLCAIIHTFLTGKFTEIAHKWERWHEQKIKEGLAEKYSIHHGAKLFHFLGEVEVVFGLWVIALTLAIFIEEIKGRLETQYLPRILKKGYDPSLVKEAFDQRFEEIKLLKLQEFIPGLLPVEKRPPFIDPKWDSRDDSVPGWVTLVHVFFLTWIIVNAHHPPLFISALLFSSAFRWSLRPIKT